MSGSDRIVMRRRRAPQPAAGGPVPWRRKLDPPPVDRISALSDDLLREIIVLLPVKDGGRAQAFGSRWRHLWRSTPLNLDCCDPGLSTTDSCRWEGVSSAVSPILSNHPGPVRRLCARSRHLGGPTDDALLRSAALDSLEELEFVCCLEQRLPAPISRFSDTLYVLSIAQCGLTDDIVQGLHFSRLKQLGLKRVHMSERALHGLITRCPVLNFLLVYRSSGFRCLRINSLSLTSLCVNIVMHLFDEIIIENAPRLERLIHLYLIWGLCVSAYYVPKVETLDILTNLQNFATKLEWASKVIQGETMHRMLFVYDLIFLPCPIKKSPIDIPTTAVHTVKSLSINMDLLNLDKVVDLMRLFPCLEKMHVKSDVSNAQKWWHKNWWRRKHRNFIRSHDIRVKTLVLEPYLGTLSHVNFATFFVLNARELELMTLQIKASVYNDGFLVEQYRKLQLDNKVSKGAMFHFTTTSCQRVVFVKKHLRDFDLNDPFLG